MFRNNSIGSEWLSIRHSCNIFIFSKDSSFSFRFFANVRLSIGVMLFDAARNMNFSIFIFPIPGIVFRILSKSIMECGFIFSFRNEIRSFVSSLSKKSTDLER